MRSNKIIMGFSYFCPLIKISIIFILVIFISKWGNSQVLTLGSAQVKNNEIHLSGTADISDNTYIWVLMNYNNSDNWEKKQQITVVLDSLVNWDASISFIRKKIRNDQIFVAVVLCNSAKNKYLNNNDSTSIFQYEVCLRQIIENP